MEGFCCVIPLLGGIVTSAEVGTSPHLKWGSGRFCAT